MTIFGHDVSHHQAGIDVGRLAARFIIARTAQAPGDYVKDGQLKSYGLTIDGQYYTHKGNAQRAGKLFAAYLYLGNRYTPAQNAQLHAQREPDRGVPVMVDWEYGSGDVPHLRACIDELGKLGYRVFLTYAPKWYLNDPANGGKSGGDLRGLPPVCSSKYPDYVPRSVEAAYLARSSSAWESYGGNTTAISQFTSTGRDPAYSTINLDCLAFEGTDAQLQALFNPTSNGGFADMSDAYPTPKVLPDGTYRYHVSCANWNKVNGRYVALSTGFSGCAFQVWMQLADGSYVDSPDDIPSGSYGRVLKGTLAPDNVHWLGIPAGAQSVSVEIKPSTADGVPGLTLFTDGK